jgi:ORF6N domain
LKRLKYDFLSSSSECRADTLAVDGRLSALAAPGVFDHRVDSPRLQPGSLEASGLFHKRDRENPHEMKRTSKALTAGLIEPRIFTVRGQKVILDSDLALIYGVPTYRFNEAVKRNKERFPEDFRFQLNREEADSLTSQFAMSKPGRGGRRSLPYAFTEHGAVMAANILNSSRAVRMSVFVVRAFVKMRSLLGENRGLAKQLAELEKRLTGRLDTHEIAIVEVLKRIMSLLDPPPAPPEPPKRRIGFENKATKPE